MSQEEQESNQYVFKLYITGMDKKSALAINNLKKICEKHLKGRFQLEIIDIYQNLSNDIEKDKIIASPTLIKLLPLPIKRIMGDLSNSQEVLATLDIKEKVK